MILKFLNKDDQSSNVNDLLNVACLMIHAAKIDQNYTDKEKKIIKYANLEANQSFEVLTLNSLPEIKLKRV